MKIKTLIVALLLGSCASHPKEKYGYKLDPLKDHTYGNYPGKWRKQKNPIFCQLFPMGYYAMKPVNK